MLNKVKLWWKDQKGVTLIELLAVVVILGIIAAVAAPSVFTSFDNAKINADKQTKAVITEAAKRYVLDQAQTKAMADINVNAGPDPSGGVTDFSDLAGYIDGVDSTNNTIKAQEKPKEYFTITILGGVITVGTVIAP